MQNIQPFDTGNPWVCGRRFEDVQYITLCTYYRGNISSRLSSNYEAFASELLENIQKLVTVNKLLCGLNLNCAYRGNRFSRLSRKLEVNFSELLENLKDW